MLLFLLFLLAVQNVVIAATNQTIDDTLGDLVTGIRPIYSPSEGVWEDATCKGCAIQPDPSLAFDGTWTAATYNPTISTSIELNFKGESLLYMLGERILIPTRKCHLCFLYPCEQRRPWHHH